MKKLLLCAVGMLLLLVLAGCRSGDTETGNDALEITSTSVRDAGNEERITLEALMLPQEFPGMVERQQALEQDEMNKVSNQINTCIEAADEATDEGLECTSKEALAPGAAEACTKSVFGSFEDAIGFRRDLLREVADSAEAVQLVALAEKLMA